MLDDESALTGVVNEALDVLNRPHATIPNTSDEKKGRGTEIEKKTEEAAEEETEPENAEEKEEHEEVEEKTKSENYKFFSAILSGLSDF